MSINEELFLVQHLNNIADTKLVLVDYEDIRFTLNTDGFSSSIVLNSNCIWHSEDSDDCVSIKEQIRMNLENLIADLNIIKEELSL
jgi:hypothetical protein